MKIARVETFQIETPRYYGQISGHVIVKVHVDDGPVGLGEASDSRATDLGDVGPGSLFLPGVDVGRSDSTSTFTATRQWVSVLEWPQGKVLRVILGVRVR